MTQAFDYFLLAYGLYMRFNKAANAAARDAYAQAISKDSTFYRARADLAYSMLHAWFFNWDSSIKLEDAQSVLQPALDNEPDDYYHLWIKAALHLYRKDMNVGAVDAAYEEAYEKAKLQAIPEDLQAFRVDRAEMWLLTGRAAEAVPEIVDAINKTPVPEKWFYWVLSWAHYENNEWQEALDAIRDNISTPRNAMRKNVVASLVSLGSSFLPEAENEAKLFLDEEASQGITYKSLNDFLELEDKVPFSNPNRLAEWKSRLADAFKKHLKP